MEYSLKLAPKQSFRTLLISAALLTALPVTAQAATTAPATLEEMWAIIEQQQLRIEQLEAQSSAHTEKAAATEQRVSENSERVLATGDYVESLAQNQTTGSAWSDTTQIGGYGELHYNNLQAEDPGKDTEEIDFHRFVVYFNHQFNDRLRFFSELELEHSLSGEGKNGEIELEQAYIQYDLNEQHHVNGGLFLVPVGLINETHEPNTFYGVERNSVENIVVPTTWWEAGAALGGRYSNGMSWDLALTSGLAIPTNEFNSDGSVNKDRFRVRSGRQKVSEAAANDLAYTGRLKYTGVPGLELAASYQYQADASQEANDGLDQGELFSTHIAYQGGPFQLRALWSGWKFKGDAVEAAGADKPKGWYIEPAIRIKPMNYNLGFYARYEDLDAATPGRPQDAFSEWQAGINYWPVDNVVLKFDYRDREHDNAAEQGRDFDGFDLGLGYVF